MIALSLVTFTSHWHSGTENFGGFISTGREKDYAILTFSQQSVSSEHLPADRLMVEYRAGTEAPGPFDWRLSELGRGSDARHLLYLYSGC